MSVVGGGARFVGQRALLVFFGCGVAFGALEATLQVTSLVVSRVAATRAQSPASVGRSDAVRRIICLGDSHTWGHGVPQREQSYPARLGDLLRSDHGDIEVINLGRSGQNSSQLVNSFQHQVAQYAPQVAIVLIGVNNEWNFEDLHYADPTQDRTRHSRWFAFKTYKLAQLLAFNLSTTFQQFRARLHPSFHLKLDASAPLPSAVEPRGTLQELLSRGWDLEGQGDHLAALRYFSAAARLQSDDPNVDYGIGTALLGLGRLDEALVTLQACAKRQPDFVGVHTALGQVYRELHHPNRSVEELLIAIAQHPKDSWAHRLLGIVLIRDFSERPIIQEWGIRELRTAFELDRNFSATTFELSACLWNKEELFLLLDDMMQRSHYHLTPKEQEALDAYRAHYRHEPGADNTRLAVSAAVLRHDLETLRAQAQAAHVTLYLLTYAARFLENDTIRDVAKADAIPLIDLESVFADFRASNRRAEYFIADWHPTAKGYQLMADIIAARLKQDLVPHE